MSNNAAILQAMQDYHNDTFCKMKAVKIKKNGGPEVLEVEEITLRKPIKTED